jgi:hypothetical protein
MSCRPSVPRWSRRTSTRGGQRMQVLTGSVATSLFSTTTTAPTALDRQSKRRREITDQRTTSRLLPQTTSCTLLRLSKRHTRIPTPNNHCRTHQTSASMRYVCVANDCLEARNCLTHDILAACIRLAIRKSRLWPTASRPLHALARETGLAAVSDGSSSDTVVPSTRA